MVVKCDTCDTISSTVRGAANNQAIVLTGGVILVSFLAGVIAAKL